MRCFIGVPISDEIKRKLVKEQKEISEVIKAKFVEKQNLHISLRFLGDVSEEKVNELKKALGEALLGKKGFEICIKGLGCFPNIDFVRVLWAVVGKGFTELKLLEKDIDKELSKLTFKKDKEFTPHLTLGRVRFISDKADFQDTIKESTDKEFGCFEAKNVVLFKSRLTSKGPVYEIIKEYELK